MESRIDQTASTYRANQTPPKSVLFFSSLQHMLLVLSLGMSMPVAIGRVAGLDLEASASLMAAALFSMGLAGILQTMPGRFIGSGYQSLSVSDTAALSACLLAADLGGIPLVLGMTVFSGLLRFILGSFTFRLRKLFPPEVTGTMIFILGINIVPTGFKYFLGAAVNGVYDSTHILIAVATLLFMLACTLFIKRLKPYTALLGIAFGFALSIMTGFFDLSAFAGFKDQAVVALPIYSQLSFAFDWKVVIPFVVVTIAAVVDNIGDYSACQSADDPSWQKPDWRSIECGIRGASAGTVLSGLIGGPIQSTATTNIGIAKAGGITSRKVAYLAGILLIAASFFPGITGVLSLIPAPVLGAVLLYSMCYIMAGGFSSLSSRALDDRRIFVIFLSISFAISTLIPGLYDFLPDKVAQIVVSPMVMGVGVLLITTLLGRIGTRKTFSFETGVGSADVITIDKELEAICKQWSTDRTLLRNLQICLDGLCEGLYETDSDTRLRFTVQYDQLQLKLHVEAAGITEAQVTQTDGEITALMIAVATMKNMFDTVNIRYSEKALLIDLAADI